VTGLEDLSDNFLYSFKGARHGARRAVPAPGRFRARRDALREFVRRREVGRQELREAAGLLGDSGAAACPRPMGGSPPVAGAAAGRLARYRQAGSTGPQRSSSAVPARMAGPSSGRRAVCHRERSPSRSCVLAALRALHIDTDLPRQDLGICQEDGETGEELAWAWPGRGMSSTKGFHIAVCC
jgi:hypothetical protein